MVTDTEVLIFLFILKFKNLEAHGQAVQGSAQVSQSTSFLQYGPDFALVIT